MKRWKDTLPPTVQDRKPERRAETSIRYAVEAMAALRQGDEKTAMLMLRVTTAEVRAWRKSLSQRNERRDDLTFDLSDRELLRIAIRSITIADLGGPHTAQSLRHAETTLRMLGKRLMMKGRK